MVKVALLPVTVLASKDGVQDMSVMLQMRQADMLLGASASSSPDQISALLEKQAVAMVNSGVESPYTDDGTLDGMKVTMKELIAELKSDISGTQETLNSNRKAHMAHAATLRVKLRQASETRQDHFDCRVKEDIALDEEETECNELVDYWGGPANGDPPPPCPADKIEQLVGKSMWNEGWGATLDGHVTTCKAKQVAALVYTKKEADGLNRCNGKQDDFEDAYCKLEYGHHTNCGNLNSLKADYTDAVKGFLKHSHMIASARKVNCFLDVIQAGGKGVQLDGKKVEACVNIGYKQKPENAATVEATVDAALKANGISVIYDPLPDDDGDSIYLALPSGTGEDCNMNVWYGRGTERWEKYAWYSQKGKTNDSPPVSERIQKRYTPTEACPK